MAWFNRAASLPYSQSANPSSHSTTPENSEASEPFKLYCTTNDRHPVRLVDVTELFWRELRDRGVSQHWFSPGRASPGPMRIEPVNDVPVTVSPATGRFGKIGTALNIIAEWVTDTYCLVRLIGTPVDVIQVRDKYWAALIAWPVARLSGAVYTIWLSFPYPQADIDRAANVGLAKRLYLLTSGHLGQWMLYRIAMRRADHCFVQTEEMKQTLLPFGIAPEKMTPVPMGVTPRVLDHRRQAPACNHAQSNANADGSEADGAPRTGDTDKGGTVFYLGTLDRTRELELIIDAFALVVAKRPAAHLMMVGGENNPGEMKLLLDRAEQLGITDQVEFTGLLPIEKAWSLLEHADVCWSPIVNNRVFRVGSPTKLIEYMAFEKPVVANDHPEHEAILAASGAGICVPWTADGFADATLDLLSDPKRAKEMGARGLPWVTRHRTYNRLADLVLKQYQSLLETRRNQRVSRETPVASPK